MHDIRPTSREASAALTLLLVGLGLGCDSNRAADGSPSPEASTASETASSQGQASASASAAPALSPSLAAIAAGSWKDPDGGPDVKLVSTALDKCFGFKGYSLMLPEGTKLETLMGARACLAALPGAKKGYQLVVMSDEIKIGMPERDKLKNVTEKPFDDPDAFLYKIEHDGKTSYTGWWEKKFGTVTQRCNAMMREGDEPYSFEVERAVLELCRTLKRD